MYWQNHLFCWYAQTPNCLAGINQINFRFCPKIYSKIIENKLIWFLVKKEGMEFGQFPILGKRSQKSGMIALSSCKVANTGYARIVPIWSLKYLMWDGQLSKKDLDVFWEILILSKIIIIFFLIKFWNSLRKYKEKMRICLID